MKRSLIIGIVAGALVLILLWYFVLFSPTSKDLNDTRDEVTEMGRQKQELENTVRRLKELSRNSVKQEANLGALRAAIPPTPDLGEFILQANEIASASGIDWLSITPTPPVANTSGANSTIAVGIQINGGFFQLLDYLNRLEDLDRLVVVDSISVSSGDAAAGSTASTSAGDVSTTFDDTSSGGVPSLSITLSGRLFTTAAAAPTTGTGGTTVTPTPTTPSTSAGSSTGTPSGGS